MTGEFASFILTCQPFGSWQSCVTLHELGSIREICKFDVMWQFVVHKQWPKATTYASAVSCRSQVNFQWDSLYLTPAAQKSKYPMNAQIGTVINVIKLNRCAEFLKLFGPKRARNMKVVWLYFLVLKNYFVIFFGSRTGRTERLICMVDSSIRVFWRKEVPLRGPNDTWAQLKAWGPRKPKNCAPLSFRF